MANFASSIIRVKLYAIFLGPVGFGVVAQLSNFINLIANTINLGIPLGLSSKIPFLRKENTEESKSKIRIYIEYFLKISLLISLPVTLILIIFSDSISYLIVGSHDYNLFFTVILISIPFLVLYSIIESVIRGMSEINILVKITVISAIASSIILFPIIYYFSLTGISYYLLIISILPLLIFLIKYREVFKTYFNSLKIELSKNEKKAIYKIGIVAVLSSLMQQGAMIVLRRIIIGNLGFEDNGIYQSVLAFSLNAFTLIYIFLTNYTLPKLSSIIENNNIVSELNTNFRFLLLILIPLVILIFTYKEFIIVLLYSQSFYEAAGLLKFQLIGDILRVFAALFGLWLIPKMKIKELIFIDFIFNIAFLLMPIIAIDLFGFGLESVPFCYMLSFSIHFALYFIYSKNEISFKFTKIVWSNIVYSILVLLITFLLAIYFYNYSLIINFFILLWWLYLVIDKEEKIKLLENFRSFRK